MDNYTLDEEATNDVKQATWWCKQDSKLHQGYGLAKINSTRHQDIALRSIDSTVLICVTHPHASLHWQPPRPQCNSKDMALAVG